MRHRATVTTLLALAMVGGFFTMPAPSHAYYQNYMDIQAYDYSSYDNVAGLAGDIYIPASLPVTYGKVSSIYCEEMRVNGGNDYVETGYVSTPIVFGNSDPYYFWSVFIDGEYITWPQGWSSDKTRLTRGSSYRFSVRPSSVGSYWWNFYLDGVLQDQVNVPMSKGTPLGSSERDGTEDTNWSRFRDLRKCSAINGAWFDWKDMRKLYDRDPGFHYSKTSNTEYYVLTGD